MRPVATTEARTIENATHHSFASGQTSSNTDWGIVAINWRQYRNDPLLREDKDVQAAPRTEGGRRVYGPSETRLLAFIRRGRELGFGLDDIRALLALSAPGKASCADVRWIADHHLDDIRAKITDLKKLERLLAKTIAQCSGDRVPDCPILDILDIKRS